MKKISLMAKQIAAPATVILALCSGTALAQALPGDHGRMGGGIMPAHMPPPPGGMQMPRSNVAAPSIDLALKAAQAIAQGCRQYPLGVAVVDAAGEPKLVYIPDGSQGNHGYTAIRKAYSAIVFKAPTSRMVTLAQTDAATAARIHADPNLMAFKGGVPLMAGGKIIGAIGVSGAEPGGHDEECAMLGVNAIKGEMH